LGRSSGDENAQPSLVLSEADEMGNEDENEDETTDKLVIDSDFEYAYQLKKMIYQIFLIQNIYSLWC
jgi:hypothetical protein